jgi:hypothetical protein
MKGAAKWIAAAVAVALASGITSAGAQNIRRARSRSSFPLRLVVRPRS